MFKTGLLTTLLLTVSLSASAMQSVIKVESQYSVKESADRFETIAKKKGLTVFTRIDHQANASNVGLTLRPTELVIFGNPKVGTPLMQCSQGVAIDLPQKLLFTEDENKRVWISYNNPEYLKQRHDLKGCDAVIEKITKVLSGLSKATASK